ncbi:hypothetical protein MRX96_057038 [Rhipicephalus microplus]
MAACVKETNGSHETRIRMKLYLNGVNRTVAQWLRSCAVRACSDKETGGGDPFASWLGALNCAGRSSFAKAEDAREGGECPARDCIASLQWHRTSGRTSFEVVT